MQTKRGAALRGVAAVLVVVAGYLAAQLLAVQLFYVLSPLVGTLAANAVYAAVAVALFTLAVALAGRVENRRPAAYGLRFTPGMWPRLALGLAVGVAAFLLVAGPLYLVGQYRLAAGSGGALAVAHGLLDFIVVGYMEELLCRGFLLGRMAEAGSRSELPSPRAATCEPSGREEHAGRSNGAAKPARSDGAAWEGRRPIFALCATALIFAALHLFNPSFSLLAFLNIFLAGTFMGAVMYATGSLWAAVGVHITWNWVQGSVLGIPVSGGERFALFDTQIVGQSTVLTGGEFGAEASVVCTVVLALGTALCLWLAKRSGRLAGFGPAAPGDGAEQAGSLVGGGE